MVVMFSQTRVATGVGIATTITAACGCLAIPSLFELCTVDVCSFIDLRTNGTVLGRVGKTDRAQMPLVRQRPGTLALIGPAVAQQHGQDRSRCLCGPTRYDLPAPVVVRSWISSGPTSTESRTRNAFTKHLGESQTKASNDRRPAFSILFANNANGT
jgi:hypothetical protein